MPDDYILFNNKKIFFRYENYFRLNYTPLKNIIELEDLFKFKNLNYLHLSNNYISEINGLEYFPNLIFLVLNHNHISKISNLENVIKLKKLELNHNRIKKIKEISHLVNLEELDLSVNQIEKIENLDSLKKLKKLILSSNNISKIENLDKLRNLELLALSGNQNIAKIENLDNLMNLKKLILEDCKISKIEGLSRLKKLNQLVLTVYDIDYIITEIEGLEHLVNLDELYISSFNINTEEMDDFDDACLLRFACMVKKNNYELIEDWQEIFKKFPHAFDNFQGGNSIDKIEWYILQCSKNLLTVIQKILKDPIFNVIRKNQVKKWNKILKISEEIFSRKEPRKSLKEIIVEEEMEEYGIKDEDIEEE